MKGTATGRQDVYVGPLFERGTLGDDGRAKQHPAFVAHLEQVLAANHPSGGAVALPLQPPPDRETMLQAVADEVQRSFGAACEMR